MPSVAGDRGATVQSGIGSDCVTLACSEVVIKNIRVAELVRGVVKGKPARCPTRSRDDAAVFGYALGIVTVKIRDVDFAVLPGIHFERDFCLGNALRGGDGLDNVIG